MQLPQKTLINPQVSIGEPVEIVWQWGKFTFAVQKFQIFEGVHYHEHPDVWEVIIRLGDKPFVSLTGQGCHKLGHSFVACQKTIQLSIKYKVS